MIGIFYIRSNRYDDKTSDDFCCSGGSGVYERRCIASLYLSQPTVSQAIRELEKHYNGLLFERLGKKLYLTERGQLLLPQARNLIRQFQQLEELMLESGAVFHTEAGFYYYGGNLFDALSDSPASKELPGDSGPFLCEQYQGY